MIGALTVVFAVLLGVFALQLTGGDLGDLRDVVVLVVNVLAVCVAGLVLLGVGVVAFLARPWRNGHSETLTRPEGARPLFATSAQVPDVAKGRVPENGQRIQQARRTVPPSRTPAVQARQAAPGSERDDDPDRRADRSPQPPGRPAPPIRGLLSATLTASRWISRGPGARSRFRGRRRSVG